MCSTLGIQDKISRIMGGCLEVSGVVKALGTRGEAILTTRGEIIIAVGVKVLGGEGVFQVAAVGVTEGVSLEVGVLTQLHPSKIMHPNITNSQGDINSPDKQPTNSQPLHKAFQTSITKLHNNKTTIQMQTKSRNTIHLLFSVLDVEQKGMHLACVGH